jgi:DNA-binding transcriptional ArsR family regulator
LGDVLKQSETILLDEQTVSSRAKIVSQRNATIPLIVSLFAFFVSFLLISSGVLANIQYYEVNTELSEDGVSSVRMIITFAEPEMEFSFDIIGRVKNFTAESIAGPVDCKVDVTGISLINCKLNLTREKRQLEIRFLTSDFVKSLEDKIFFSGDFTLNKDISSLSASLKLPTDSFLVGENVTTSMISFPESASIYLAEDGRILINWRLVDIEKDQPLRFEALYQKMEEPIWLELRIRHFIFLGAAFAFVFGFLAFRYFRKSQKLVLSVLDEYERRIVNILLTEDRIKQKKIVKMTKLSKAKVSRVIKSLAERGLVEVERRGRTNLLRLKKKKLSGEL